MPSKEHLGICLCLLVSMVCFIYSMFFAWSLGRVGVAFTRCPWEGENV